MKVDLGAVLSRAYQTVIRHKVLWALGFVVALLSSGAGSSNFQYRADSRVRFGEIDFWPGVEWVIVLAALALLVVIGLFLLRAVFDAGLIAAGDRSARDEPPTFREAWQDGRAGMWPVVALNLIFVGFMVLLVFGVSLVVGLAAGGLIAAGLLNADVGNSLEAGWHWLATIGIGVAAVIILALLVMSITVILGLALQLAQRAAVLDGQRIGEAWGTGWRLIRQNLAGSVGLLIVQVVVNVAVGAVTLVIISPLLAIVVAMAYAGEPGPVMVLALVTVVAFAWLVSALVRAVPMAWSSVLWTLFYRAVTVGLPQPPAQVGFRGGQMPPAIPGAFSR